MKLITKFLGIAAVIAVIGFITLPLTGCPEEDTTDGGTTPGGNPTVTGTNQTPVAADYNVSTNLNQTANSVTAVTVTAKQGKSTGAITVYYEGTGGTTYSKSTSVSQTEGTYAVTFNVAAASGWNAANGLSAGTLTVAKAALPGTVATPSASHQSGKVATGQVVTLACGTQGAEIRYTSAMGTNEPADPTATTGTVTTAITINVSITVKVRAFKDGIASEVLRLEYEVDPNKLSTPSANPTAGARPYGDTFNVTLTSNTPGVSDTEIYYTDDNTDVVPTMGTTKKYTAPFSVTVNKTVIIKAITMSYGKTSSDEMTVVYTPLVAIPTADKAAGTHDYGTPVTLSTTTPGAAIRYTTDGSEPTANTGTVYSTPIVLDRNMTVKAIAVKADCTDSEILTRAYNAKVAPPTTTTAAGEKPYGTTIALSSTTPGVTYYYTIDGTTTPTTSSTSTTGNITLNRNMTIKAIAVKANCTTSDAMSNVIYTAKVAAPTTTTANGASVAWESTVPLSSTTPDVTFHYTLDGTAPTTSSPTAASGSAVINKANRDATLQSLRAIAVKANCVTSDEMTAPTYTLLPLTSTTMLTSYLGSFSANTTATPITVKMNMGLGDTTAAGSGWENILSSIGTAGKYVAVDLSPCAMTGTAFGRNASTTGKNRVVSLTLPNAAASIANATSFANSPFGGYPNGPYTSLTSISSAALTSIGDYAFSGCTSLTSVSFPEATTIGNNAFANCTGLTNITSEFFPKVISIGEGTFSGCTNLASVSFPKLTAIPNLAFQGLTKLASVSFPEATTIGMIAFGGCTSLTSVSFPEVTTIGNNVFGGGYSVCTSLASVSFPKLTALPDQVFYEFTSLTSVSFPEAITIGQNAFANCTGLTSVTIPGSVTSIGNFAFNGSGLTSVTFATGSNISNANFGTGAFPTGSMGGGSDVLKEAYLAASPKAGTYTAGGYTWTKTP
jgi:hypothetical protein